MRNKIVAANWKLNNLTKSEVQRFFNLWVTKNYRAGENVEVIIFPPAHAITQSMASAYGRNLKFGFQNIYHKESGAFTGENSVLAAKDLGLSHILIGHSERRQYFNESNENCRSKIELCWQHKLIPMYCIGETEEERNLGTTQSTVGKQLLEGLPTEIKGPIILAYEPVWAIGTGNVASPEDAQKVHSFIRNLLLDSYGKEIAEKTQILYGGSVKGKNAGDLFGQTDIDGGLVGGASLKADSFYEIIEKSNA